MKSYYCSGSAPDLASRDECSLTSAIFEMDKLAKHCLKKKKKDNSKTPVHTTGWPACVPEFPPNLALVLSCHRVELSLTKC